MPGSLRIEHLPFEARDCRFESYAGSQFSGKVALGEHVSCLGFLQQTQLVGSNPTFPTNFNRVKRNGCVRRLERRGVGSIPAILKVFAQVVLMSTRFPRKKQLTVKIRAGAPEYCNILTVRMLIAL